MKQVVVVGGGIGGVEAAISLRKEGLSVTLISDRDYFFMYPLSIWIPTGETEFDKVAVPLADLAKAHGFQVLVDGVKSIKVADNRVELSSGELLNYDYLVVALGGDKVQRPGQEHTYSTCGEPEGALQFRDRLDELLAQGSGRIAMGFGGNPKDPSGVRGGPAFELIFNVHNTLAKKGVRDKFELSFFAPMAKPGIKMGARVPDFLLKKMKELGIKTYVGKKIKSFAPDGVVFEDDSKLKSDLTMFIPATTGKRLLQHSDLPLTEAGFVRIDDHCQVEGFANVYAVGDSAAIEGPDWRAKQGHLAEVMARAAAFNIAAAVRGSSRRKGYKEHLSVLCVMDTGKGAYVVNRTHKKQSMVSLPVVGHQLKKAWGTYYRLSKLKKIPRIPGM